jgi:DNA invertase Pin-like site-specific DNA recombinase
VGKNRVEQRGAHKARPRSQKGVPQREAVPGGVYRVRTPPIYLYGTRGDVGGSGSGSALCPANQRREEKTEEVEVMLVGYARVSTEDQNLELQRDALNGAKCEKIFEEKKSGAKAERPELMKALDFMRPGDVLVVWKLSRLGRTLKQLIETVELLNSKGMELKSLNESIDTTTATGKLLFHIIASFAQFERDNLIENTRAGLQAARARGKKGGRKRVMDDKKKAIALALRADPERPVSEICQTLGISRATFYRYVRHEVVANDCLAG